MQQIGKNVYVETGFKGSNDSFVKTSEGLVFIDTPQFAVDAVKWRDIAAKHGNTKYVIYTEPHQDHVNGAFFLSGTFVGHIGTRQELVTRDPKPVRDSAKGTPDFDLLEGFHFQPPTITFTREMTLYVGDHTFKLVNLPGHTPWQTAVYCPEEKTIFTSDNVVYQSMPFLRQSVPDQWLQSLKEMGKLDFDYLVPGHGEVSDKRAIPEMEYMIREWINIGKEAIARGLTLEQAQQDKAIAERIQPLDKWEADQARLKMNRTNNLARLYALYKK